jgi:hypothetical protein
MTASLSYCMGIALIIEQADCRRPTHSTLQCLPGQQVKGHQAGSLPRIPKLGFRLSNAIRILRAFAGGV